MLSRIQDLIRKYLPTGPSKAKTLQQVRDQQERRFMADMPTRAPKSPEQQATLVQEVEEVVGKWACAGLNVSHSQSAEKTFDRVLSATVGCAGHSSSGLGYKQAWELWNKLGGSPNQPGNLAPSLVTEFSDDKLQARITSVSSAKWLEYKPTLRLDLASSMLFELGHYVDKASILAESSLFISQAQQAGWVISPEGYSPLVVVLSTDIAASWTKENFEDPEFLTYFDNLALITPVGRIGPDGLTAAGRIVSNIYNRTLTTEPEATRAVLSRLFKLGATLEEPVYTLQPIVARIGTSSTKVTGARKTIIREVCIDEEVVGIVGDIFTKYLPKTSLLQEKPADGMITDLDLV